MLGFFLLFRASGLEQQPSRPPPAAEAGRRGWGRALIFQSLAKRLQKKSASATRQGGISAVTKATVRLWLARGSQRLGMSNVVAAAAFARGIFNLTRTGIAAELTAASEQRLPPVGGRCRIATKRGVQGSEAGAVVSGMRTPLQGVKHTLGTTTRDRAAVRLHLEYHMPVYG